MGERLQKVLAAAGVGSRRTCETWIEAGRVRVNGQVVTELGTRVDLERDKVTFDGRLVRPPIRRYYIALNKPRGVVSSRGDVHAAHLVTDLVDLSSKPMLRPVGRLDADTEGLIFLTDDGDFLYKLTHPKHHVPKTYRAVVRGVPDPEALARLERGIVLEDGPTAPAQNVQVRHVIPSRPPALRSDEARQNRPRQTRPEPELEDTNLGEPQSVVELTIFEGRNRQVRRMMAAIGFPVINLTRISIGHVRLTGLPVGAWRHLTLKEIAGLTGDAQKQTTTEQENTSTWHAQPPSRPQKAPSSPGLTKKTRPSRPRISSNSPKRDSTTG